MANTKKDTEHKPTKAEREAEEAAAAEAAEAQRHPYPANMPEQPTA